MHTRTTLYHAIDVIFDAMLHLISFIAGGRSAGDSALLTPLTLAEPKVRPDRQARAEPSEVITPEIQPAETAETPFRSVGDIIAQAPSVPVDYTKNQVMYVRVGDAAVFPRPTFEFDAAIHKVRFGDMVMVLEQKGRFAKVVVGDIEGWVLRDDLVSTAAEVYPEFTIGVEQRADHPNTLKVRAVLKDMFDGGKIEYPLQAGEYVAYRLFRKGITIPWPKARPRVPGRWNVILKGVPGVHMSVSPKTGSVMEYMLADETGHVAYVESVFPDETVSISEANFPDQGIYNERVLTREEWRELRPVFIQIS